MRPNQIAWYSETAEVIRATNGGRVANALAFFHIPFLEYELVSGKVGDTQEGVYDADLNSGLYTAFVEAGDVKATFVGHDHGTCGPEEGRRPGLAKARGRSWRRKEGRRPGLRKARGRAWRRKDGLRKARGRAGRRTAGQQPGLRKARGRAGRRQAAGWYTRKARPCATSARRTLTVS